MYSSFVWDVFLFKEIIMKKLWKVLMIAALLITMCACGGGGEDTGTKKKTVGVIQLVQHDALDSATKGFCDALYEEFGEDGIDIIVNNASGDSATCSVIANGYVSDGVDLIMANATPSLLAAYNATSDIPILGTSITEYSVALDLDNYNGTVGGNVSGTSDLAPLDEQAQMILDLFPDAKSVALLYCSGEPNSKYQVEVVEKYLVEKGVKVNRYAFTDSNDISSIADSAAQENDVMYVPTDNTAAANGDYIGSAAERANIPVICGELGTCQPCRGVATLTIDYYELGYTTGKMAIKVLNGADISTMPIEYYAEPIKMYDKDLAEKFGVNVPSDYVVIE